MSSSSAYGETSSLSSLVANMPSVLSKPEFQYILKPPPSYYKDFSMYLYQMDVMEARIKAINTENRNVVRFADWVRAPDCLRKTKLPDLKLSARLAGLRVSGNKTDIIHRLEVHFVCNRSAIRIQRVARGFFARALERLHGPAMVPFRVRRGTPGFVDLECVNPTDFHSMCPLSTVPREAFFSYRSADGFLYGFDVCSLVMLFRCTSRFENPYTREEFTGTDIVNIQDVFRKMVLVAPHLVDDMDYYLCRFGMELSEHSHRLGHRMGTRPQQPHRAIPAAAADRTTFLDWPTSFSPLTLSDLDVAEELPERDAQPGAVPAPLELVGPAEEAAPLPSPLPLPLEARIDHVCARMTELTAHTVPPEWFHGFSRTHWERYYHFFYVWWTRLNGMQVHEKQCVCGPTDPFAAFDRLCHGTDDDGEVKELCVQLTEQMVYAGADESWQRRGCMQVLTIMSIMRRDARQQWPDLCEL
jgi:hypothetical protein